jgi:hypothetical protein
VPPDLRRQIDVAVARQNPSSDELLITSVAQGKFSEGSRKQTVYTTYQFGKSMVEHVSFFAIFTDGHLSLTQDEYNGKILRTVRLPGADVDYLVLDTVGSGQGNNHDYVRVISLRDAESPKLIADVGIAAEEGCALWIRIRSYCCQQNILSSGWHSHGDSAFRSIHKAVRGK